MRERGDLAKYAVERGLARQVLAAVGKRRDDELRRRVAELGLIGHFQHALPLGARESLRGLGLRPATLVSGSYASTHTFGWTEFNIDAVTQELLVTTWGIDPYTQAQLNANPALITSLTPEIVSQFRVSAVPTPAAGALLGLGGLLVARRRRLAHA